jgi:hypothetical protein
MGSFDAGKMEFRPAPLELRVFVRRLVANHPRPSRHYF